MAERLPKARPGLARVTEALTRDAPVKAQAVAPQAGRGPVPNNEDWDTRFAMFLERVMATAAIGGDAEPLRKELEVLLNEAPPGKREELESQRGKPPTKATAAKSPAPKG